MRPVDKGKDLGSFKPYNKACAPLQDRLGEYCSYCERWIAAAIEVEHILPKKANPSQKYRWSNFLLACKNCNTGKGSDQIIVTDYLWPDLDNTFLAFCYDDEGRAYPNPRLPPAILEKAKATWTLTNLNWHPDTTFTGMVAPSEKDHRHSHRKQAWIYASDKRNQLLQYDTPDRRVSVAKDALQRGMFSVWMTVFNTTSELDREIRRLLIENFVGTATNCFDRLGNAHRSSTGQI
ncbi:HNH nuclease [Thiobacillus denitrificans ATCC 25259]|uniref:HNH nuclease n=1 Tax=Thiobacillus denitrificans (strain ATCC 25259 / T1) TaxID=292415 RepID=Q3SFH3_THIDA|nr:HNH endonuclease [Thiobacillus denitrificans]AAZ98637.1 HNH nuclease [Thiobacillus denitrificans ATCC 25259]